MSRDWARADGYPPRPGEPDSEAPQRRYSETSEIMTMIMAIAIPIIVTAAITIMASTVSMTRQANNELLSTHS